ncbi:MAG TPA: hypothetical protein DCM06_10285, partial [Comamonadaceae bacterium]|nr:hypothetical protein [Comamonadaceae bacterium]
HKADATGVVLKGRIVQAMLMKTLLFGGRRHGTSFDVLLDMRLRGKRSIVQCNKDAKFFIRGRINI